MRTNGMPTDTNAHWYALRVHYNRIQPRIDECREARWEYFAPTSLISSLLFVRCGEEEIVRYSNDHFGQLWLYRNVERTHPAVISDREMEVFRFVVTSGQQGLTLLGDDRPEYHLGDRVVVTDGPFKGAEGHIKRIKKDRRLVVSIPGVVAVATAYIHPKFLKRIGA